MPLLKKSSSQVVEAPKQESPTPEQLAQVKAAKTSVAKAAAKAASSKEEYWANREANDHARDIRISRQGLFQSALQSVGLLQLNTGNTFEDYMTLVEQTAERGLQFVSKE